MKEKMKEFRIDPVGPLYRRFEKKKYAEEFLAGEFRLKSLRYYRDLQDKSRRDQFEGISSVMPKGEPFKLKDKAGKLLGEGKLAEDAKVVMNMPERFFISCFSRSRSDLHRSWGRWVVRINQPSIIFREIAESSSGKFALIWGPVVYADIQSPSDAQASNDLWRRKRQSFSHEDEFRFGLVIGHRSSGLWS